MATAVQSALRSSRIGFVRREPILGQLGCDPRGPCGASSIGETEVTPSAPCASRLGNQPIGFAHSSHFIISSRIGSDGLDQLGIQDERTSTDKNLPVGLVGT